jgi:hypothetical protein
VSFRYSLTISPLIELLHLSRNAQPQHAVAQAV